jgi:hypothetical protein
MILLAFRTTYRMVKSTEKTLNYTTMKLVDFCEDEHAFWIREDGACGEDVIVVEGDETKVLVLGSNKADGTI